MDEELKPCPFCGAEGRLIDLAGYEVHCTQCGCDVVPASGGKSDAIAAWNRRPGEDNG